MKVNIWTVTTECDEGTGSDIYSTQQAAEAGAAQFIELCWGEHFSGRPFPDDHWAALTTLQEQVGFMDSCIMAKHDIDVPVTDGEYVYEKRFTHKQDGGCNSYEDREDAQIAHENSREHDSTMGIGLYRRPVKPLHDEFRPLEHIADFEHEDECDKVLELIAAKSSPVPVQKVWAVIQNIGGEMTILPFSDEALATNAAWEIIEETFYENATEEDFEEFKSEHHDDMNSCWVQVCSDNDTLHVEEINWPNAAPAPTQKTRIAVIVEGGVVQEVCSDSTNVQISVVDYDIDGSDAVEADGLPMIPQQNGDAEPANVSDHGSGMIASPEFWAAINCTEGSDPEPKLGIEDTDR